MKPKPAKTSKPETPPKTQAELAKRLGCSRQLISAHAKKPNAPPIADVEAWVAFLSEAGRDGSAPPELRKKLAEERIRLLKAAASREEIRLAKDRGAVMDITEAQEVVTHAHTRVVAALDRVFLNELPPVLKGLDELGIRRECKEKIDAIKAELSINEEPISTREQRKVETE